MVVVAGQPGAGKAQIADLVQAALNRRGGAVRIGRDLYKPAHRQGLAEPDDFRASPADRRGTWALSAQCRRNFWFRRPRVGAAVAG
ncbi:zeta toxin family protein [Streptomyces sp. NPDC057301]|uniref:zeta toxin family protein n=1 Tax=Streptomyces sp. NPDC057301 TaxID=3346093 RepID=UPI00362A8437